MKKTLRSLPFVIYGIFLFFTLSFLFGVKNILLVPIFLLLSKKIVNSNLSKLNYFKYGLLLIFIAFMSFVACINIYFKLFINFVLIFLFTFIYSDEFTSKNHFVLGLELLLLQVTPICFNELIYRLVAVGYSYITLIVFMFFYKKIIGKEDVVKKGLDVLINNIKHIRVNNSMDVRESYKITSIYCHDIHANVVDQGGVLNNDEKFKFYLLLHFQYLSQLVYDISKTNLVKKDYKYFKGLLKVLGGYDDYDSLKINLERFKDNYSLSDKFFNEDFLLVINSLIKVLNGYNYKSRFKVTKSFKTRLRYFGNRINIKNQSFRYALQLSIIIFLSLIITLFIDDSHSMWIPITVYGSISLYPDDTFRNTIKYALGMLIGFVIFAFITRFIPDDMRFILMIFLGYFVMMATENKIIKTIVGTQTAIVSIYPDFGLTMSILIRVTLVMIGFILASLGVRFVFQTKKEHAFYNKIYELKKRERDLIFELEKVFKNKNPYNTGVLMMLHLIIKELYDLRKNQNMLLVEKIDKILNYSYRFITDINKTAMILDQKKVSGCDSFIIKEEVKLIDKVVKGEINFKNMPNNIYEVKRHSHSFLEFQFEKSRFTIGKFQREIKLSKKHGD
ncbi:MAG: FUSC family protein [Bacilli bacterium]|nr:FUSC family protein [Bacilli bacterium]